MATKTKKQKQEIKKELEAGGAVLIVFNDDYNTFDFVISCFVDICKLAPEEAIAKTFSIHNNGSDIVKEGEYDELKIMKDELIDCGLSAAVQRPDYN